MNKVSVYKAIGIGCFAILLLMVLAPIMPFHDDWWYLTAPKIDFTLRDLLPDGSFWRPFDAIFGGILNIVMLDRVLCLFRKDDPMPVSQRIDCFLVHHGVFKRDCGFTGKY